MIAGAGPASANPSRSLSSRFEPCARQSFRYCSIARARALGAGPGLSSTAVIPSSTVPKSRRSVVAALFIALVTEARSWVCFASMPAFSICTRWIEPYDHSESDEPNPLAGLLFQFTSLPDHGLAWCGWPFADRKPFHSYLPVPFVGRRGSTRLSRIGSRPAEYVAMFLSSAYATLNVNGEVAAAE